MVVHKYSIAKWTDKVEAKKNVTGVDRNKTPNDRESIQRKNFGRLIITHRRINMKKREQVA